MPFTWQTNSEKNKRKNYQQAYQSPLRYLGQTKVLVGVLLGCFVLFLCLCNYLITFFSLVKESGLRFDSRMFSIGLHDLFNFALLLKVPEIYLVLFFIYGLFAMYMSYRVKTSFAPLEDKLVQGTLEWESETNLVNQYYAVPVHPLCEGQDYYEGKPGFPISRVPFNAEKVREQDPAQLKANEEAPQSFELKKEQTEKIKLTQDDLTNQSLEKLMKEARERKTPAKSNGKTAIKLFEELHIPEIKPRKFYYLIGQEPSNSIVLALTRGGKDVYFINPFIDILSRAERIEDRPSFIMTATKGDEPRMWYDTLKQRGYLVRICNTVRQYYSDPYNPLSVVFNYYKKFINLKEVNRHESTRFLTEAENELKRSAFTFFQSGSSKSSSNDEFWVKACRNLFMSTGLAIADQAVRTNEPVKFNPYAIYNIVNEMQSIRISENNPETGNHLENLKFFDENERVEDAKEVDPDGVLDYRAVNKKGGKGYEIKKMDEGGSVLDSLVKKMVSPTYYRWKINWIPIFITLIALALAVGLFVIRAGRLGIEVVFNYIWTNVTAFFHIRDLRKFKQAFQEIFVGLIAMASMFVLFYLYIAYNSYISNGERNVLIQALLYVGGAWLLFDGPAIIQKQLGIDAGLSTAGGVLTSMGAAKAANLAINSVEKASNAGSGIMGILAGIRQGRKESSEDQDSSQERTEGKGINPSVDKDPAQDQDNSDNNTKPNETSDDSKSEENVESKEEDNSSDDVNDHVDVSDENESVDPDALETDSDSGESSPENDDNNSGINDQMEHSSEEQSDKQTENEAGIQEAVDDQEVHSEESDSSSINDSIKKNEKQEGINDNLAHSNKEQEESPKELSNQLDFEQQEENQSKEDSSEIPESQTRQEGEELKKPVKPQNPLGAYAKERLLTPKSAKYNKSAAGNLYESHQKGKALGKDLVQYTRDRKAYKKDKKSFDELKES